MNNMICKTFAEVDLQDPFWESLRTDYDGFDEWFRGKNNQKAFIQYDDSNMIKGFLYLKVEEKEVDDINPPIYAERILKVGTFKIDAHGTKLGEQFIKVIMDYAITEKADVCYVTIYSKHTNLIHLVNKFGFKLYGTKGTGENIENVYLKDMADLSGDINADFPMIHTNGVKKYLLGIYPQYHSVMFPNSILTTENKNIIKDVSYTNSIHKIYVCAMQNIEKLNYGDIVVVYRTAEVGKSAEYNAVATSVGVVEDIKLQDAFGSFEEFYQYASQYSVFDKVDLQKWYRRGGCKAVKMTYNAALEKRITRHDLIEHLGLDRNSYWGFMELTDEQFQAIVEQGRVNEDIIKP